MAGMLHQAFTRWRKTNLKKDTRDGHLAQTTLTFGEGGLPNLIDQGGAPRWSSFHVAFIPQATLPNQRELNPVVVYP